MSNVDLNSIGLTSHFGCDLAVFFCGEVNLDFESVHFNISFRVMT